MNANPKIVMAKCLAESLWNSRKKVEEQYIKNFSPIIRKARLKFSQKQLKAYSEIVKFDGEGIPLLFPYNLITHMQFSLVNDKTFPFSPFGLVHKKETMTCHAPLKEGEWEVTASINGYREVERGYEVDFEFDLRIDGDLVWRSVTTAFKKLRSSQKKKEFKVFSVDSQTKWFVPNGHGFKYGLISNNIDLIHISHWTAKLMGHKAAIMHGMWTVARGLSEYKTFEYPLKFEVNFRTPIYMPATVQFEKNEKGFGVYSEDGKRQHLDLNFIEL
jgi:acyl dehydratase